MDILKRNLDELARVFVVSQVEWLEEGANSVETSSFFSKKSAESVTLKVRVAKADGEKCVRCWNYSTVVGTDTEHPGLCGKCLQALRPQ